MYVSVSVSLCVLGGGRGGRGSQIIFPKLRVPSSIAALLASSAHPSALPHAQAHTSTTAHALSSESAPQDLRVGDYVVVYVTATSSQSLRGIPLCGTSLPDATDFFMRIAAAPASSLAMGVDLLNSQPPPRTPIVGATDVMAALHTATARALAEATRFAAEPSSESVWAIPKTHPPPPKTAVVL